MNGDDVQSDAPENGNGKRSLRELLPKEDRPRTRTSKHTVRVQVQEPMTTEEAATRGPVGPGSRFKPRRINWKLWGGLIVLLVVLGGGYLISGSFAEAVVHVTPRQESLSINEVFTAKRSPGTGEMGFEVLSLEDEEKRNLPASGTENVERKASGTIIVYNNYSEKPEKLIKNTRFESKEGKVYRIQNAITIPGKTVEGGKTIPGSLEVLVHADQPGDSYNNPKTSFTIPGLKGDPRFETITAESKTALAGGFIGQTPVITETDRARVRAEAEAVLSARLKDRALKELSSEHVVFAEGMELGFSEVVGSGATANEAVITFHATLSALAVRRDALAVAVARKRAASYDGSPVLLSNPESLEFKLGSPDAWDPAASQEVSFGLKGTDLLVWQFDAAELREKLKGLSLSGYQEVVRGYPSIAKVSVDVSFPWVRSFPDDPERITIELVAPEA